jgi:hypothetical protein
LDLRIEARDAQGNVRILELNLDLNTEDDGLQGDNAGASLEGDWIPNSSAYEQLTLDEQVALELADYDDYGTRIAALMAS